ncbi:prepilin-type N-terminal cleavage/methylation domain-containing protein [Patescibacteria group bacterium]|nr:prepilin-type N-terminal cleavage/methylation domain-containing protein [Patescibacteria group bacterium]
MKKISKNEKAVPTLPTGRQAARRGFSFIELMIVICIISIMTALILVSMNAEREKKAVEIAAREVAAVVREAQNYALTGKNLKNAISCSFIFTWTGNSYSISNCKNQSYSLKNGVTFSNNGSFSFSIPFANLDISSTKDIGLYKGSSSYHVCVYVSGVVSESLNVCPT